MCVIFYVLIKLSEEQIDYTEFWVTANARVRASGAYNFEREQIQVNHRWDFNYLENELVNYDDKEVITFSKFGWPLNASRTEVQHQIPPNQKSAREHPEQIKIYLAKELKRGSLIGPFHTNPFGQEARFSPLDTREKRDSDQHRIIINLSHPFKKGSVNHSIDKDKYLNQPIKLSYPSVEDLAKIVRKKGRNCKLFKKDLQSAYKQMFMDPGDIHLLGYVVEGHMYFDVTLCMGAKSSCYCCQRTTNLITYIFRNKGYDDVNYLDDLGGAEVPDLAEIAFQVLGDILNNIGILESPEKACAPNEVMIFLGILINSRSMTLEITEERRQEIFDVIKVWRKKCDVTLREVQQLLGKLVFAGHTVRASRVFISRIINALKMLPDTGRFPIPDELRLDLVWWERFMDEFNGISLIPSYDWKAPDRVMASDACLTGCGGWSNGQYFHASFPKFITRQNNVHINELELLTVMVAVKIWANKGRDLAFLMYCDNETTVNVINKGAASNEFAQSCLREICYWLAHKNAALKMVFKPGSQNRIPDHLSRWDQGDHKVSFFRETQGFRRQEVRVCESHFRFTNDW